LPRPAHLSLSSGLEGLERHQLCRLYFAMTVSSTSFGDSRRFIRCDQSPASPIPRPTSGAICTGVKNPKNLSPSAYSPPPRTCQLSLTMPNLSLIQRDRGRGELRGRGETESFNNIWLLVASPLLRHPSNCKSLEVSVSIEATREVFYGIYERARGLVVWRRSRATGFPSTIDRIARHYRTSHQVGHRRITRERETRRTGKCYRKRPTRALQPRSDSRWPHHVRTWTRSARVIASCLRGQRSNFEWLSQPSPT